MSGRRDKVMEEVLREMLPEQFEKSSMEMVLLSEKRSSEIIEGFLKAMGKVMGQAVCRERKKSDEQMQYLLFSCLHSSIFLKRYLIRIDLMGQGLYNDAPLATSYWDAEDIYCLFEKDVEEVRRKVGKKLPRLREYEVDDIRYAYAPYYHRMAKAFIRQMMEEMLEGIQECGQKMQGNVESEKKISILFGEYMGEADTLFVLEKERFYEIFQYLCR